MPLDILRDSTIGQILNKVSGGKILPYRDQKKNYVIPARYLPNSPSTSTARRVSSPTPTLVDQDAAPSPADLEKGKEVSADKQPATAENPFLVDWEPNDPDNPRNWSRGKRLLVGGLISLYTASIYMGSAIYTASIPGVIEKFHVDQVVATLGLSLFIVGYGVGPMFLAPLQDMPFIGRNPPYIIGVALFVLFQVPVIYAPNIGTILVFRTLAGFVGSPALATGGASMGDIFPMSHLSYAIALWACGAVCGPVFGPVIGGFAAQANGWKWPIFELLWISGFSLIVLSLFLPETLGATILLRRAERLRKLTGNKNIKTQTELDQTVVQSVPRIAWINFVKSLRLNAEPAVLFSNIYIGLVYSVFYLWFEAFPLVFNDIYHFNQGVSGLPYLGFVVAAVFTLSFYFWYLKYSLTPRYMKNPNLEPEVRFELAIFAAFSIPISLFIFGWTSRSDVHWIGPVIGAAIYFPGIFLAFQSILVYLGSAFPTHVAAVYAGNCLFRSVMAASFPLFGKAFFVALGIGGGSSLLAGVSLLMIPLLYLLRIKGAGLRAKSKWTN